MKLDRCILKLRPRNLFEIMDLALVLGRSFFRRYLALFAMCILPLACFNLILIRTFEWDPLASVPLLILEAPFLQIPFVLFSSELVFDPMAQPAKSIRRSIGYLFTFGHVYLLLRPILLILPLGFLVYFFRFRYFLEVTALERLSSGRRRERMRFLHRHDDSSLVLALVLIVVCLLVYFGVAVSYHLVTAVVLGQLDFLAESWVEPGFLTTHIGLGGFIVFSYVVFFLEYLNLRTKREGWDLSLQFKLVATQ